jgi:hypothetical protein
MQYRFILSALAGVALGACTSLLPRASSDAGTGFANFEEARVAAGRIVPMQTRVQALGDLGFDIDRGQNVTLIPYPEIVVRLTPHPGVPINLLDAGIRQCIEIQMACRGYVLRFEREDRKREGGFWLDFFNVDRTTRFTGWRFEALIVVSNEMVLFRNFSGQARIEKVDRQRNPLGPFQPAGEGVGSVLVR